MDEIVISSGPRRQSCNAFSGYGCYLNFGGSLEPHFFFPSGPIGGGGFGDLGAGPDTTIDEPEGTGEPPGEGPEAPAEVPELTVTATPLPPPPPDPIRPTAASLDAYSPFLLGLPAPKPKPRPRRRPPKPGPKRRTRPRRSPPGRSPKPGILRRIASTVARIGRVGNFLTLLLWPEDLGGGEQEFLDQYYGGYNDDDDTRRAGPIPNIGGLPNYGGDIGGLTVTAPRPGVQTRAQPFVSAFGLPLSNAPALFAEPRDLPAVVTDQAHPRPQPQRTPRPLAPPVILPFPTAEPLPIASPSPRSPAPRIVPPTPLSTPLQPGVLHLPAPQPTPMEATDKCNCPKKKPKKKRDPRSECHSGTYKQTAKSILYQPKRKIACQ